MEEGKEEGDNHNQNDHRRKKRKKRKKPAKLTHHLASEIATFRASLASVFGQIIVFAAFMDHFCSVPKKKSKKRGEIN